MSARTVATCRRPAPDGAAGAGRAAAQRIFCHLLSLVVLLGRNSSSKDIELLVLRHAVAMPRRANPRPRMDWADRAVFAALLDGRRRGCAAIALTRTHDPAPTPPPRRRRTRLLKKAVTPHGRG